MFEDVRHEESVILLLSLTDLDILGQSKYTDHEMSILKNLALPKLHRQRIIKQQVAIALLYLNQNYNKNTYISKYTLVYLQIYCKCLYFLFNKWPGQI